jgi:hypothetical protein
VTLSLEQQPALAILNGELAEVRAELAVARAAVDESERAKKIAYAQAASTYGYVDADALPDVLRETDSQLTSAWHALRSAQAKEADCEYRLDVTRRELRAALGEMLVQHHTQWLAPLADLLEALDAKMQDAANVLGLVSQQMGSERGALGAELLRGSNGQIAQKIRKAIAR